ncbi:NnrS family protein [Pseudorhodoplanes sp.]|uniref:NnrS family protein n=1 Tax=Pseudorhodoplanes sp. TaxID=1934341 RepID=UPI003D0D7DDF
MSIPAALERRRNYAGPALFSYGFRPFFVGGAVWAALTILIWIPLHSGAWPEAWQWPSAIAPLDWHVHEMLYGYVPAIVAGFLLTAIPNWTGRLPVCGASLAALFALWIAGRVAMVSTAGVGLPAAAIIDATFLLVLLGVAAREVIAGRNWRNLRVLVIVSVLALGNIAFHVEIIRTGAADYGTRVGIAAVILLISLVGGRIVPSFTNNWLVRENPGRLPIPFGRYDMVTLAVSAIAFVSWIVAPSALWSGALLIAAGLLHIVRLARWAGDRTWRDRLVLVLHVAYAFVPAGFLLTGAAIVWPDIAPASAGIHAWTAGAIGMMTIAVMTRASLGHTKQPLAASPVTQAIYLCLFAAALMRIAAAMTGSIGLLHGAATLWVLAFGAFAASYGPLLIRKPPVWQQTAH